MPMPGAFRAQFKYPLLGKVFYLDLPEAEASSLAPDIQKLGGVRGRCWCFLLVEVLLVLAFALCLRVVWVSLFACVLLSF